MSLSTEKRCLLYLVRTRITEDMLDDIKRLCNSSLDWEGVLEIAISNGIAPLLYHNIKKPKGILFIPHEVIDKLRKAYYENLVRNMYIYGELKRILNAFREEEIEVIVLKGAALTETVYGNIGLRRMNDIDILVRKQSLDKSDELMIELGYVPNESWHSREWYRKNHHHLAPFLNQDNNFKIEIHHNIISPGNPFHFEISKLWFRAQSVVIGGVNTLVLSPEDLIVHLCLHSFYVQPLQKGLRNVVDISHVVRFYRERINWGRIIREAREGNFTNYIYYPLYLARNILGMETKKEILDALKAKSNLGSFEDCLLRFITRKNIPLQDQYSPVLPIGTLEAIYKELLRETSVRNKLISISKIIFLPRTGSIKKNSHTLIQKLYYLFYLVPHFSKLIYRSCYWIGRNVIKSIIQKTA